MKSPQAAAALALTSGLDSNSGDSYKALGKALKEKLVAESDIDRALRNVLNARFRLGEFDPPAKVPYAAIDATANATPESDALALQAARESMVLLRNDSHVLPLGKKFKKVAVIGPNADDGEVLLGNYNGFPLHPMTILESIRAKLGEGVEVIYSKGCEVLDQSTFLLAPVPRSALTTVNGQRGLQGEYFANRTLQGAPAFRRTDTAIDFVWGDWGGALPFNPKKRSDASARWTGRITAPPDGRYRLSVSGNDIFRLYLNGRQVLDSAPEVPDNTGPGRYRSGTRQNLRPAPGNDPARRKTEPQEKHV